MTEIVEEYEEYEEYEEEVEEFIDEVSKHPLTAFTTHRFYIILMSKVFSFCYLFSKCD